MAKKITIGDKVNAIENHPYLGVTKRMVGIVFAKRGQHVEVIFPALKSSRVLVFQQYELKKSARSTSKKKRT